VDAARLRRYRERAALQSQHDAALRRREGLTVEGARRGQGAVTSASSIGLRLIDGVMPRRAEVRVERERVTHLARPLRGRHEWRHLYGRALDAGVQTRHLAAEAVVSRRAPVL